MIARQFIIENEQDEWLECHSDRHLSRSMIIRKAIDFLSRLESLDNEKFKLILRPGLKNSSPDSCGLSANEAKSGAQKPNKKGNSNENN